MIIPYFVGLSKEFCAVSDVRLGKFLEYLFKSNTVSWIASYLSISNNVISRILLFIDTFFALCVHKQPIYTKVRYVVKRYVILKALDWNDLWQLDWYSLKIHMRCQWMSSEEKFNKIRRKLISTTTSKIDFEWKSKKHQAYPYLGWFCGGRLSGLSLRF